jgi:RNA polymerase sigma-70 factor (ECF subfamily)
VTAAQDFGAAFAARNADTLASLLSEDVALEVPPATAWYAGREVVAGLLLGSAGRFRLVPVAANGQSAFAAYRRTPCWGFRAHSIVMLTMRGPTIARITVFRHPELFEKFHLPTECLPPTGKPPRSGL